MNRRYQIVAFIMCLATIEVHAARPNVVLIMADDLGYHDLACYGHPKIKTPVLDQLANEGVKLTHFYAGATVCTPSRMALLTGCYPARLGWSQGVIGHIMKKGTGLHPKAVTLAEVFQAAGYRTGMTGKWHLGDASPFRPHRQGFESAYYINKSNNQTTQLWMGDEVIEDPFQNRLLTEKFTREAIRFIGENRAKPFFLYLPYTAPHFPLEAHPEWKGKSDFGVFGDVVEEMDHRIGEILAALDEYQLASRTLVVFLSDNGPEPLTKASKATPFRGKKWDALEGGTRVPCLIRYPGQLSAGSEISQLISAMDLLPTLCHACGVTLPNNLPVPIDGVDVWDTLLGNQGQIHPRKDLLYWHGSNGFQAIRMGPWKLFPNRANAQLARDQGEGPALFRLDHDVSEGNDVSSENQAIVKEMQALAEMRLPDIGTHSLPLGHFSKTN